MKPILKNQFDIVNPKLNRASPDYIFLGESDCWKIGIIVDQSNSNVGSKP